MGLRMTISKALDRLLPGAPAAPDIALAAEAPARARTFHATTDGGQDHAAALAVLEPLRAELVKQGKGQQTLAATSMGMNLGVEPDMPFKVLDEMHEQSSWVRAVVSVIVRAVTAKGWTLRPLTTDASPENEKVLRAFFNNPNPQATLVELLDDVTRDCHVYANAFWELVRGTDGKPRELWTLDATTMRVRIDSHGLVTGYVQVPGLSTQSGAGVTVEFVPNEVIHVALGTKGSSVYGHPQLASLVLPITVDKLAQVYNRAFFNNGAKIRVAYVMKDATPEQVERNRDYLRARAKNLDMAQADLVLEGQVEVKLVGTTQKDMEFLELRVFTRDEVLAVYGVPPSMVSIIETGNIGSGTGDTQRQNFYEELVGPFQRRVAERLTKAVIREGFGFHDWAFEFNARTIDEKAQAEIFGLYISSGVLRAEEVRPLVLASLPQLRKAMGIGESHGEITKASIPPAKTLANATRAVVRTEDSYAKALRKLFKDWTEGIATSLPKLKADELRGKLAGLDVSFLQARTPVEMLAAGRSRLVARPRVVTASVQKALPELEVIVESVDGDALRETLLRFNMKLAALGAKHGAQRAGDPEAAAVSTELEDFLKATSTTVAANIAGSLRADLRAELVEGISNNETMAQLRDRLAARLDKFLSVKVSGAVRADGTPHQSAYTKLLTADDVAESIARTEANRAYNLGQLDALEGAGVVEVQFLLASDACEICREVSETLPGEKLGKTFTLEEAREIVPVHTRCRCTWVVG